MAYTKTVWQTGDVITAAKLNNMEGGIEAHDPIILEGTWTDNGSCHFDISPEDMTAAFYAGKTIVCHYPAQSAISAFKEGYGIISYVDTAEEGGETFYGAEDTLSIKHYGASSLTADGYFVTFSVE